MLNTDRGTARSLSRSALAGKHEWANEVAITLEEKGTIYQSDVEKAMQRVNDQRNGIENVEGEIIQPDGNVIPFEGRTLAGEFKIHESQIPTTKDNVINFPQKTAPGVITHGDNLSAEKAA